MNRKQRRALRSRPLTTSEIAQIVEQGQQAYLAHLQKSGVDTSAFPVINVLIPELGITRPSLCLPNEMKPAFMRWVREEYLPGRGLIRVNRSPDMWS